MAAIIWVTCGAVIVTAAIRLRRHPNSLRGGRVGVGVLYIVGGAVTNAAFLLRGDDYSKFADGSYIAFVRHTWRTLVVPNHDAWISMLIAFELAVGVLALLGGRRTQLAYAAAIAFHIALLPFGWGFYLWSVPMLAALAALLHGERRTGLVAADPVAAPDPAAQAAPTTSATLDGGVDLYWIPLGAGHHSVRFNGIVYEAIAAGLHLRRRRDLYHSALAIQRPEGRYMVEMTPVPDRRGDERGVVRQGPVGVRALGRMRVFRYEIRRWRNGVVPDLNYAVASPLRITTDPAVTQRIFDSIEEVPALVWGRDELRAGEMWSCNSITAWVLTRAGVDVAAISLPPHGRAPGWDAGIAVARRRALPRTHIREAVA